MDGKDPKEFAMLFFTRGWMHIAQFGTEFLQQLTDLREEL